MPPPPPPKPTLRVLPRTLSKPRIRLRSPLSNPKPPLPHSTTEDPLLKKPSIFTRFLPRFSLPFHSFPTLPQPISKTLRVLRYVVPLVPIGFFFSEHIAQVIWVSGPSMTPYLNEEYETMQTKRDLVLVNMVPFKGGLRSKGKKRTRLERGMVVMFRSPANPSNLAIKRIIGLPGDRITTRDPYPKPTQIVPFNHVWVEGDAEDPRKSLDSNTYGPISVNLITGRVEAVLWPRMRWLKWEDWEAGEDSTTTADGGTLGKNYREDVRRRVLKEAVKLQPPPI